MKFARGILLYATTKINLITNNKMEFLYCKKLSIDFPILIKSQESVKRYIIEC